jgi:hypothetical protein
MISMTILVFLLGAMFGGLVGVTWMALLQVGSDGK